MTKSIGLTAWSAAFLAGFVFVPTAGAEGIDTDHLFAFNVGTDIGNPGEKEVDVGFAGRFGRNGGAYAAIESELSFQYTTTRDLVLQLAANGAYHRIKDVPGMDDRNAAAFAGLSVGLSYRLLDRARNGLGLAVSAEPSWTRVDDDTGEPVNGYSSEFVLAGDFEIVPNALVGVLNLSYEPEVSQSRADGSWSRQNTAGIGGGVMLKLREHVFAGIEARYLRRYGTLDFSSFTGQAFYLGPTVSITLTENTWLTFGWSTQAVGRAVGEPGTLDLVNFDRHRVRLAFGTTF
jgi:hypothetical protein